MLILRTHHREIIGKFNDYDYDYDYVISLKKKDNARIGRTMEDLGKRKEFVGNETKGDNNNKKK